MMLCEQKERKIEANRERKKERKKVFLFFLIHDCLSDGYSNFVIWVYVLMQGMVEWHRENN